MEDSSKISRREYLSIENTIAHLKAQHGVLGWDILRLSALA
jgi:hypothetical protein